MAALESRQRRLDPEILAEGLREINLNHEYWTDHTMQELKEVVLKRLNKTQ